MRANGGGGFVPGIERLGLPDLNMADSSVGVGRGVFRGRYSTALPSTLALASSWDKKLALEYGTLIGRELPLNGSALKMIAVIGSHADVGVLSGGGSAQVDAAGGNAVKQEIPPHPETLRRYLPRRFGTGLCL